MRGYDGWEPWALRGLGPDLEEVAKRLRYLEPKSESGQEESSKIDKLEGGLGADSFRAMALCSEAVQASVQHALDWVASRYGRGTPSSPSLYEALLAAPKPPAECGTRRVQVGQYIYCCSHFGTVAAVWRARNPAYEVLARLSHPGALGGLPAVLDPEAIVRAIVGDGIDQAVDAALAALAHLRSLQS